LPDLEHHAYSEDDVEGGIKIKETNNFFAKQSIKKFTLQAKYICTNVQMLT
jgi:hypothetical protein